MFLLSLLACRGVLDLPSDSSAGCALTLSTESLDFGQWSWVDGAPPTQTLSLDNHGDADCNLLALETEGEDFEVGQIVSPTIPPHTTQLLSVSHLPTHPGTSEDTLTLTTDSGVAQVALSGTATAPELRVEPEQLSLNAELGCSASEPLTLRSAGLEPLQITSMEWGGLGLTVEDPQLPWTLAPGEQRELWVDFQPLWEGGVEGTLTLESDDPLRPTVQVPLIAQAPSADWIEERFQVPPSPAVDFLFTVDTSSSMKSVVTDWEATIAPFFSALDADGVDYRVTAVVADHGCVLTDPRYADPTRTVADKAALFADMVCEAAGSCGGSRNSERPFTLMATALRSDKLAAGGCNQGILRADADLALVAIGDEPEQSANPYTYYVSFFQGLKADPSQVRISAVAGDYPSGCKMDSGASPMPMTGAYEASLATGGLYLSICDSDWPTQLAAAASDGGTSASFELSALPVPETLLVRVDGVHMATGWAYVPSTNTLELDETPAPGSVLEVVYAEKVACP